MQSMMAAHNNSDAVCKVAATPCRVGRCLLADALAPASTDFSLGRSPLPLPLTYVGKSPEPQGKSLVPPLRDGWQRMCHTHSEEDPASECMGRPSLPLPLSPVGNLPEPQGKSLVPPLRDGWQRMRRTHAEEGPVSERTLPFVARSSLQDDDFVRACERVHVPFRKACVLLTAKRTAVWQQRELSIKGSVSARTWGEYQQAALKQGRFHSNADRMANLPLEQPLQRESMRVSCSESMTISSPMSSAASVSSAASTIADLVSQRHAANLVEMFEASSVEPQSSSCEVSFKQKHAVVPQQFDMSADDWDEMDDEFFPERCPVIHKCS